MGLDYDPVVTQRAGVALSLDFDPRGLMPRHEAVLLSVSLEDPVLGQPSSCYLHGMQAEINLSSWRDQITYTVVMAESSRAVRPTDQISGWVLVRNMDIAGKDNPPWVKLRWSDLSQVVFESEGPWDTDLEVPLEDGGTGRDMFVHETELTVEAVSQEMVTHSKKVDVIVLQSSQEGED
ncbi:Uncharacterized protein DAT39_021714, partial [Clarias magur]